MKPYFITIHDLDAEEVAEFENMAQIGSMKYHIGRYRNGKN